MSENHVTIQLTSEQQQQIKNATGKDLSELNIDLTASGSLSEKDLEKVAGGAKPVEYLKIKLTDVIISG